MVILDENHIEKTDTVIHTTTYTYSLLLHDAHTRSSLAGIKHTGISSLKLTYIVACHGRNSAHTLHHVEHETLSLQQRTHTTGNIHCNVALLHLCAILNEHLNLKRLVKTREDALCHLNTGKHTILLDKEHILSHSLGWNSRECSMVTVTDILGKCKIDKLIDKFVFYVHNNIYFLRRYTIPVISAKAKAFFVYLRG